MRKTEKEEFEKAKALLKSNAYASTTAEAIADEANGNKISAGLFWGLISAPRRQSHGPAMADIEKSAELLNLKIPDNIQNMRGLQAKYAWAEYISGIKTAEY